MEILDESNLSSKTEAEPDQSDVSDLNTSPTSGHTQDELEVADFLITSMKEAVIGPPVSIYRTIDNLVVFPWGRVTSTGIQIVNTCLIDN